MIFLSSVSFRRVDAEFNVSPFIQSDSRHYAMQGVRRWSGEVRGGGVFNQATGTLAVSSDSSICVSGVLWLVLFCLFFYLRSSKTSSTVYSRVSFWPPLLSFRHWCSLGGGSHPQTALRPSSLSNLRRLYATELSKKNEQSTLNCTLNLKTPAFLFLFL